MADYKLFGKALDLAERAKLDDSDFAGPDESYYIRNQEDVEHAAQLLHHANDPDAVKEKIKSIAKRKGLKLPATWQASDEKTEKMVAAFNRMETRW